jgi:hypothetical protein
MFRSRIIGHERVSPALLLANPSNHRRHPEDQRESVRASLGELGFVKSVIVNKNTGRLIDGHLRWEEALLAHDDDPSVLMDVEYVDLSEKEELLALAVLDRTTDLAEVDPVALDNLLRDLEYSNEELDKMLAEFAEENGLYVDEDERELTEEDDHEEPRRVDVSIIAGNPPQVVSDDDGITFILPIGEVNNIINHILKNNPDLEIDRDG